MKAYLFLALKGTHVTTFPRKEHLIMFLWKDYVNIAQAQLVDAASQMAQVNFMEEEDGRYHWPS